MTPSEPRSRSWRRRFRRVAIILSLLCVLPMGLLLWFENRLVYYPLPASEYWEAPPDPAIEDVWLETADGVRIHAWWCPAKDGDGAVLFCHGNGGNVSGYGKSILRMRERLNRSVLVFDYPGYGKSEGRPSEKGCYAAAEAGYRWLTDVRHIPGERILLYGDSLGGGVAVELASKLPHEALVLVKTFTSLPAVAKRMYPWLPCHTLMGNRFDNLAKIGKCRRPVFIASAACDRLVPFACGEELYEAAPGPKRFLRLEGCDHNDPMPEDFLPQVRAFVEENRGAKPPA